MFLKEIIGDCGFGIGDLGFGNLYKHK